MAVPTVKGSVAIPPGTMMFAEHSNLRDSLSTSLMPIPSVPTRCLRRARLFSPGPLRLPEPLIDMCRR